MFSGCEKAITHCEVDYLKESLSAMHVAQWELIFLSLPWTKVSKAVLE